MTDTIATLVMSDATLVSGLGSPGTNQLETGTLPAFLPSQRWFGAKDRTISAVSLLPLGELVQGEHALIAADVNVGEETQRYLLPVSAKWSDHSDAGQPVAAPILAVLQSGSRIGMLIDSALETELAKTLLDAMRNDQHISTDQGALVSIGSDALRNYANLPDPRPLGAEQSNVSIAFGTSIILKLYRRLRAGEQPDVEVARFLTDVGHYKSTPEFLGEIQHRPTNGEATTIAAAFAFVPNQGDAWAVVTNALTQSLIDETGDAAAWIGAVLGQRTAEMHKALAVETAEPDFKVEALQPGDIAAWASEAVQETKELLAQLEQGLAGLPSSARAIAEEILAQRDTLIRRIEAASAMRPSGGRSRIHGDYHLGQVLVTDRDVMIIDFEGEPKRSLAERRAKSSPLRDVAGMLRSFHYAEWTALSRYTAAKGPVPETVRQNVDTWRRQVSADFLAAYETHVAGASSYPSDPVFAKALTDLFLVQKAIYEVGYELANRPDWVEIPLSGIKDLLNEG